MSSPSVAATSQPFSADLADHSSFPPSPGTTQIPSASAFPVQIFFPVASWMAMAAPAAGLPSERRVTQTTPRVAPSLAWTARSVICPTTVAGAFLEGSSSGARTLA